MTNDEMLRAAATAAGIEIDDAGVPFTRGVADNGQPTCDDWRPDLDDGESRRLQIALDMEMGCTAVAIWARKTWPDGTASHGHSYLLPGTVDVGDLCSKARMAVLRCAVAVAEHEAKPG